jgi:tripartite-type tricarboxylate transporter receptor subunit TctC
MHIASRFQSFLFACALGAGATVAGAQDYPRKPIRVVTMGAPGDGADLVLRLVAAEMSKSLGQSVIVENMPGAGGIIAHRYVSKQAPPDGYTLLTTVNVSLAAPAFVKEPGYDLAKDLAPVSLMTLSSIFFITNYIAPWNSFNEMVAYAKANPGKLNVGLNGLTDTNALHMEGIRQKLGLNIVSVPYKGSAAYSKALVANEVQLAWAGAVQYAGLAANKTAKALGVSGEQRNAQFPDVPTMAELGFPGVEDVAHIMFAVGGTPRPIIDRLNAAVVQALQVPETAAGLARLGYRPTSSTPELLGRMMTEQIDRMISQARSAGIKPQ